MDMSTSSLRSDVSAVKPLKRVSKDEWEALGLEKKTDYENLRRVFERISGGKRHFDAKDLEVIFRTVGYKYAKKTEYGMNEAEDIIWEHDEDLNDFIEWEVFVQAYVRCRRDVTGKEPRRLYYLTEFMICDKDGSGTMSEDECAEVLFNRFGRSALAAQESKNLFQKAGAQKDELTYQQFLHILDQFEGNNTPEEKSNTKGGRRTR